MASKSYQEYLDAVKLTPMSRFNLPQPDHEENPGELVAQGNKILEEEEEEKKKTPAKRSKPDDTKKLESKLASTSDNPYIRARTQVLNKMSESARTIIEKMEKGELEKDTRYDTFVKSVRILGDQLSN